MPQPVVLEHWPLQPPRADGTLPASALARPMLTIEYRGHTYGLRVHEFRKFVELPGRPRGPDRYHAFHHRDDDSHRQPGPPRPGSRPTFLPLPYPAIHVDVPGKWLADPDRMVYSTSDSIAGRSYSVASVAVDPSQRQLDSVPGLVKTETLAADLQLPSS